MTLEAFVAIVLALVGLYVGLSILPSAPVALVPVVERARSRARGRPRR
jgi:hypothetical protein